MSQPYQSKDGSVNRESAVYIPNETGLVRNLGPVSLKPLKFSLFNFIDKALNGVPQQGLRWANDCEGIGSIVCETNNPNKYKQNDFVSWVKGTEYLQELATSLNAPSQGRVRVLMMNPKTTYSFHYDTDEWRLHIPLITNPSAFMCVDGKLWHLPIGNAYLVHVGNYHLALNAGNKNRIHLVFDNCASLA